MIALQPVHLVMSTTFCAFGTTGGEGYFGPYRPMGSALTKGAINCVRIPIEWNVGSAPAAHRVPYFRVPPNKAACKAMSRIRGSNAENYVRTIVHPLEKDLLSQGNWLWKAGGPRRMQIHR